MTAERGEVGAYQQERKSKQAGVKNWLFCRPAWHMGPHPELPALLKSTGIVDEMR